MSTDRELLELAAKPAGIALVFNEHKQEFRKQLHHGSVIWDPLKSDSDAMDLACRLNLSLDLTRFMTVAYPFQGMSVSITDDCYRRAIVRAAAEIGRRMP